MKPCYLRANKQKQNSMQRCERKWTLYQQDIRPLSISLLAAAVAGASASCVRCDWTCDAAPQLPRAAPCRRKRMIDFRVGLYLQWIGFNFHLDLERAAFKKREHFEIFVELQLLRRLRCRGLPRVKKRMIDFRYRLRWIGFNIHPQHRSLNSNKRSPK